ncbi:hypothetical protein BGX20_002056, partial [Mortierella sp. AD010]
VGDEHVKVGDGNEGLEEFVGNSKSGEGKRVNHDEDDVKDIRGPNIEGVEGSKIGVENTVIKTGDGGDKENDRAEVRRKMGDIQGNAAKLADGFDTNQILKKLSQDKNTQKRIS